MGFTRNYDMLRMMSMGVNTDCNALQASIGYNGWYLKATDGSISYNRSGYHYYNSYGYDGANFTCYSPFKYWMDKDYAGSYYAGTTIITFGTNGAEESYDDYKISTFSTSRYETNSNIQDYNQGNFSLAPNMDKINNTVYCSYLNTSGTTQTIREIGVITDNILIYRKVLNTPLVVPAGGYFKISFSYSVPIPKSLMRKTE